METKDIFSYSDEEFVEIISTNPADAAKAKSILSQGIDGMQRELDRMNVILADVTQRSSLLLALAGLFAFLPQVFNFGVEYMSNFLIWTFPFLTMAIVFFYLTSVRITTVLTQFPTAVEGSKEELVVLRTMAFGIQDIWKLNYVAYNRILKYFRYCSAAVYVYLISLTINLYLFTFSGSPDTCYSLSIFVFMGIVWYLLVHRTRAKSYTMSYGGSNQKSDKSEGSGTIEREKVKTRK